MEDSPIVQEVPSQAHVNPQLDHSITSPKQAAELNKALSDFWRETDEREAAARERTKAEAPAPPPSDEPAAQQQRAPEPPPKEEPPPAKARARAKEEPPKETTPKESLLKVAAPQPPQPAEQPEPPRPDAAAESAELPASATPEQKGQFKQLKQILKESQQKLKMYQDVFSPLLRELGHEVPESAETMPTALVKAADQIRAMRSSAMTPDTKAELELLRGLQRAIDVVHSPEFAQQYTIPRDNLYFNVLDEIARNCDEELQPFFKEVKEKFRPNNMDDAWWEDIESRMTKASNIERTRIREKIAKLKQLQMDYDKAIVDKSADQKGYQAWLDERQKTYSKDYEAQVQAAVSEAFAGSKKHIAHWLPQDETKAKDSEEKKRIQAHNARFDGLRNDFSQFLMGTASGPRQAALNALEFLEARENVRELTEKLEASAAEAEELRGEVARLKAEVDKRRKIADAPMKPTAGAARSAPEKPKAPIDGRKSLNEAMKNFNWPG